MDAEIQPLTGNRRRRLAAAAAAFEFVRRAPPQDQPNHVKEDMAFFQQAKFKETSTHTYLKRDSDKFWFGGVLIVGMGAGSLLLGKGLFNAITGTGKKAPSA